MTPEGVDETESWRISDTNVTQMPLGSYCFTNLPEHRFEIVSGALTGTGAITVNLAHRAFGNCAGVDEDSVEVATSSTIGQTPPQWRHEPFYIYLVK
ncbi:MAG: hypothetical protein BGO23_13750 [Solirubrobacterales bacterium 67-14]|mgnify:FL=1|nr:MAG: hypothetical protein BGO23_13750 [Solirubrobacterales bacterium 67-14]